MMAQTFSCIIPRSPVTVIAPCKKETRSNSKLCRDRRVPKRPTSQRPVAEAVSTHLAGRARPSAGLFFLPVFPLAIDFIPLQLLLLPGLCLQSPAAYGEA